MSWNTTAPDGSISVKANESILQDNTTYIKTAMNKDHYWDTSANQDGHHNKIEMDKETSDPTISSGMDGIFYLKDNVSTQPFYRNGSGIMQMLGIRAMAVFNGSGALAYSFNVSSVTKSATGRYTVNFSTALPNNDYLVLGGAIRNSSSASSELLFEIQGATSLTSVKSTSLVKVMTRSDGGSFHDPLQAWIVCFGG